MVKNYPQYNIVNFDMLSYCSCLENVTAEVGDCKNYKFVKVSSEGSS
jgi:dTDP-D-glucose 4,6-dehydratase